MEIINIMFDTNAIDKIQGNVKNLVAQKDNFRFLITNIQKQEIDEIPDDKKEKRDAISEILQELQVEIVPISFTFDYIDFSNFTFVSGPIYDKVLKNNKSNLNDALIAASAEVENCIVITNDKELLRKIVNNGEKAMTYEDFIEMYIDLY